MQDGFSSLPKIEVNRRAQAKALNDVFHVQPYQSTG